MFIHTGPPIIFLLFFILTRLFWIAILIFLVCLFVHWITTQGSHWNPFRAPTTSDAPYPSQATDVPPTPYSGQGTSHNQPSALEILARRYASGDIDATTFEHMRERILASQTPSQE
jgi:uncharacterized membrane protein